MRSFTRNARPALRTAFVAALCLSAGIGTARADAVLAAGLRNKEIAQRLHRSARTVDHHLVAIFGKLGVATRAEAVSAAYRLGVVAASPASA